MTGRVGLLIDDEGEGWADDCPTLMGRLGVRELNFDFVAYAVRNLGFIHLLPSGANIRVSLRGKRFSAETLITALYQVVDYRPQRILLAVFADEAWSYKIFASIGEFTAYAEALAAGEPTIPGRLFAFDQDSGVLRSRNYAPIQPMLALWRATRGRMEEDFWQLFHTDFFRRRSSLVRKVSASRIVCEHVGIGIKAMQPCEALRMLGREMGEAAPDFEYSQWVAESYAEAAAGERPRVTSVRAHIKIADDRFLRGSYGRVLLPWRRGDDTMVLGMSILRDRSFVA